VLGLDAGVPAARAAFWALPDGEVPTDLVLIEADWNEPELAGGAALLARMHEAAIGLGAAALRHHVDDPPRFPQYQEHEAARVELMTRAGYALLRDGLRWQFTASPERGPPPLTSLSFRGLPEVGEATFLEAMTETYEGTRDAWLTREIQERGLVGAARSDFRDYQEMDYEPEWWELAYAENGALAGVVMPARTPRTAVIGYVGVVPGQRGRGLAAQLVRRGTERLVTEGAQEIQADCDRENVAMVKAFERAGYERIARRRSFQRTLAA